MLGYGIYSVQDMGRVEYAVFSQNTFIAGAAIFIGTGALKIVLSLYGFVLVLPFVPKKKPLMAVVRVCKWRPALTSYSSLYLERCLRV